MGLVAAAIAHANPGAERASVSERWLPVASAPARSGTASTAGGPATPKAEPPALASR
jgi:hypothetical protein